MKRVWIKANPEYIVQHKTVWCFRPDLTKFISDGTGLFGLERDKITTCKIKQHSNHILSYGSIFIEKKYWVYKDKLFKLI